MTGIISAISAKRSTFKQFEPANLAPAVPETLKFQFRNFSWLRMVVYICVITTVH